MEKYHINTNFKNTKDKDYSISFARFMATIFIFLCHYYQYYCDGLTFWFNVSVQMFFFISGLLYANRKIDDPIAFLIKGFKKILVPYYIYVIIACVIGRIFIPNDCTWHIVLKLLCLDAEGSYMALNNLWFISHILFCYIMAPLFLKWLDYVETKKPIEVFVIVCLTMLGILVFFYNYGTYYKPWDTLCFFFGLIYGRMAKNVKSIWLSILNVFIIIAALLMKIVYVIGDSRYKDYINANGYGELHYQLYKISHAFLGVAIIIVLVYIYKFVRSRFQLIGFEKLLKQSDRFSYYIYLTHQIFLLGAFSVCGIFANKFIALIVAIIGTALATGCLYILSQRVLKK